LISRRRHSGAPAGPARNDGEAANKSPANRSRSRGFLFRAFCRYVRGQNDAQALADAEIVSRGLAAATIGDDVERDLLTLVEGGEARSTALM